MRLQQIQQKLEQQPKRLFLIDGVGAMLSAFFLAVVLVQLESFFGIPSSVLYILATFPVFFAAYDFYCYARKNNLPTKQASQTTAARLRRIAGLNILYCVLSLGLALAHRDMITFFGWAYILAEIFVVIALACIEIGIARTVLKSDERC